MRRYVLWGLLVVAVAAVTAVGVGLWAASSDTNAFLFTPERAIEAAPDVRVSGEAPDPPVGGPGILLVAVGVKRATVLDRWTLDSHGGSDLVDEREVVPPGHNDKILDRLGREQMAASQDLAAAVAERALGRRVTVTDPVRIADFSGTNSPAARAGLRVGDVITAAAGHPVRSQLDLRRVLAGLRPGARLRLAYLRGGTTGATVTGTRADSENPRRALIGVELSPPEIHVPVPVRYDTGSIGGPSAGLAFALEIYSSLTGRRLVRGHRIAATGELEDLSGTVGQIGGIKQKTIGAAEAKADVFVVPAANAPNARRWARPGLRIIPVRTFAGALAALRALPAA